MNVTPITTVHASTLPSVASAAGGALPSAAPAEPTGRRRPLRVRVHLAAGAMSRRPAGEELPPSGPPPVTELTLELVDPYTDWLRSMGRGPATVQTYKQRIQLFLRWHGDRGWPTVESVCAWRDYLMKDHVIEWHGQSRKGLRPRTVRSMFQSLNSFWLYLEQRRTKNLPNLALVKSPSFDPPTRSVPKEWELQALFSAADSLAAEHGGTPYGRFVGARAKIIFALAAQCGLRRAEILGLEVSDFREDTEMGRFVWVRFGKGAQARSVPIGKETGAIIDAYLRLRAERLAGGLGRYNKTPRPDPGAVLLDLRNRPSGESLMRDVFQRCGDMAGIAERKITCHSLRHACATYLMRQGVDIKTISTILGHSDIGTTCDVYLHTTAEQMREAVDALSARVYTPVERPRMQRTAAPVPTVNVVDQRRQFRDAVRRGRQ